MNFSDTVCVVTGASSGIGRQTAIELASRGARLCLAARREDRLQELLDEIGGSARGHSYHVTDVSDKSQVASLADHVKTTHGRLDALVNNAGYSKEVPIDRPESIENLEAVLATNFYGAIYCTSEMLPLLIDSAPSSVINVASMAGRLAMGGAPAYSASKFALVGWSEALRFELAPREVYVGIVEPGFIPTEGFPQKPMINDPVMKHLLGTPEDVALAIVDAIAHRKAERVVPRWYYLLQMPRLLAPPLYRLVQERVVAPARERME